MVAPAPPPASDDPSCDDTVVLTDLDVITRYSLALRTASAPRSELIGVLRDDLAWLTSTAPGGTGPAAR